MINLFQLGPDIAAILTNTGPFYAAIAASYLLLDKRLRTIERKVDVLHSKEMQALEDKLSEYEKGQNKTNISVEGRLREEEKRK